MELKIDLYYVNDADKAIAAIKAAKPFLVENDGPQLVAEKTEHVGDGNSTEFVMSDVAKDLVGKAEKTEKVEAEETKRSPKEIRDTAKRRLVELTRDESFLKSKASTDTLLKKIAKLEAEPVEDNSKQPEEKTEPAGGGEGGGEGDGEEDLFGDEGGEDEEKPKTKIKPAKTYSQDEVRTMCHQYVKLMNKDKMYKVLETYGGSRKPSTIETDGKLNEVGVALEAHLAMRQYGEDNGGEAALAKLKETASANSIWDVASPAMFLQLVRVFGGDNA